MKDVYVKNPQMGDPASVDPRLAEIGQNIEKLQFEVQKFEVSSAASASSRYCWQSRLVWFIRDTVNNEEPERNVSSWSRSRRARRRPY